MSMATPKLQHSIFVGRQGDGEDFVTHYANMPMKYTAIFHGCKNVHFQMKFFDNFLFFLLKTWIECTR